MTRKEFLDKEHAFVRGTDTDIVRFYHTTIMKIFDDMEKEYEQYLRLKKKFEKE